MINSEERIAEIRKWNRNGQDIGSGPDSPEERAGDGQLTTKMDVAMVKIPTQDFSSVCRGRDQEEIQFFGGLVNAEKVGVDKCFKGLEKKLPDLVRLIALGPGGMFFPS